MIWACAVWSEPWTELEQHLEFLRLKGGFTGSSESTLVQKPICWKSHVTAQLCCGSAFIYVPILGVKAETLSRLCDCTGFSEQNLLPWMHGWKVFRIIPQFRILRLTFQRKSASKCWIWQILCASLIYFRLIYDNWSFKHENCKSCIVCNFWSSNFRNKVSIFQE